MFAHTMAMTTSDANTISAVLTRDILPVLVPKTRNLSEAQSLRLARITTVLFTALTLVVAAEADRFGGVLNLLVVWFAALVGPTAVPMILGLLPAFRRSGASAAILSWVAGIATFAITRYGMNPSMTLTLGAPVAVSALIFISASILSPARPPSESEAELFKALDGEIAR
jgi:SSS family solute:Na+ symporter